MKFPGTHFVFGISRQGRVKTNTQSLVVGDCFCLPIAAIEGLQFVVGEPVSVQEPGKGHLPVKTKRKKAGCLEKKNRSAFLTNEQTCEWASC